MRTFFVLTLLLFALVASGALAQTQHVMICDLDTLVAAGDEVEFWLSMENAVDVRYNISLGWKIYSPDGATWTDSATGQFHGPDLGPIGIDTSNVLGFTPWGQGQFNQSLLVRTYSTTSGSPVQADGLSPDTVVFIGVAADTTLGLDSNSLACGYFKMRVKSKVADAGKHICIDSVMHMPLGSTWEWTALNGSGSIVPTWGSSRCVRLTGTGTSRTAITIDGTDGIVSTPEGDFAVAGDVIKFHLRYTNLSDSGFNVQNYFKLFSPDGASWTDSAFGNFHGESLGPIGIDTTGLLPKWLFPSTYSLRTYAADTGTPVKADGISPDYLRFSGAGNDIGLGLVPHIDARHFSIIMQTNVADTGKTICIDSVMGCTSCGSWKWSVYYGGGSGEFVIPDWNGPMCVKLVHPSAMLTPVMQACPEGISGSHCGSSNYTYQATAPGGGPLEVRYNLWTGPGSLDSMTGEWIGTELAPGAYDIAVNARNVLSGLYSITCWSQVQVADQKPKFPSDILYTFATVGVPNHYTPPFTNDCDPLVFRRVIEAGGDYFQGELSLDSLTGELTYTPTVHDSTNFDPITLLLEVSDGLASDTATIAWRFTSGCVGTVGNVDCDPIEGVDIGDLTTLIDNLFITFTPLCAVGEANCDGDANGNVDIGDLTELINNLFITFAPLPACQ